MTKTIDTLIDDIHELLEGKSLHEVPEKIMKDFADRMYDIAHRKFGKKDEEEETRSRATLRISNIGKPCERQVWYGIHKPEEALPFRGQEFLKFLYGDVTEELILFLAEAAGHSVTGQQDEIVVEGVKGHRDAVIDGMLVDVKSASQYSFEKFKKGLQLEDDSFGYIGQIQTYLEGSQDDPLVTVKDKCAFLVFDKSLGHICLDVHDRMDVDIPAITRRKVEVMSDGETVPARRFEPEEDGYFKGSGVNREFVPNGNMKLPFQCSYCSFRNECWPDLRTFLGKGKPLYLTHVEKVPRMVEIDKEGNAIGEE